jgi:flagella basal body P-ring formation protein FlgA
MTHGSVNLSKFARIFASACALGSLLYLLPLQAANQPARTASPEQNPDLHSHQQIIQTARNYLGQNIDREDYSRNEIIMGSLDSRLRLSRCDRPLSAQLAPGSRFSGKTTVHIKCDSAAPWTVYLNADIKLYAKALHSAGPLNKGDVLTEADLEYTEVNLSQIRYGYFTEKEQLVGQQLKRRLPQSRLIKANYVEPPTLVKRGELVSIVAESRGYSVKMSGTAMNNGSKGERVQVRNSSSKRIVEGVVEEFGVVSIN